MIKALIFDLGGVIVPFDFKRAYARLEPLCGYPSAEISKRLRSTDLVARFETGLIDAADFVPEICGILGIDLTYDEFCELWTCVLIPGTLIPDHFFAAWKQRYRLVLLSNTNAIHFDKIAASYPELRHFHNLVLSYKVGALKPSPRIYEEAIALAGCKPEECFFTDDVAAYVDGAKAAGIDAVQFESLTRLQEDLLARGVH